MPQVHNKSFAQEGTGVRFLASISLSESGMRAVRMKNHVQGNLQKIKSHRLEKLASISDRTENKQRLKLRQSLRRIVAYRQVIEERTIARKKDYHLSLNWNYTEEGMKGDINRVLYDTDPVTIQKRKERVTVELNRQKYRAILKESRDNLSQIFLATGKLQPSNRDEPVDKSTNNHFSEMKSGQKSESPTLTSYCEKWNQSNGQLRYGVLGSLTNRSSSSNEFWRETDTKEGASKEKERRDGIPPSVLNNLLKLRQIMLPPIGVNFAHKDTLITSRIQDQQEKTSVPKLNMKRRVKEKLDQKEYASKLHKEYKRPEMVKFHLPPVQVTKTLLIDS